MKKNKLLFFVIVTFLLFVLSMFCFMIMKVGGDFQGIVSPYGETSSFGYDFYYFNTILGIIGLVLYNVLKITYDRIFNKIAKSYIEKKKRVLIWILYFLISIIFWIFVFIKSNIGGGLTSLYQFRIKFLQGIYIIDILLILPFWNIFYSIFRMVRNKIIRE